MGKFPISSLLFTKQLHQKSNFHWKETLDSHTKILPYKVHTKRRICVCVYVSVVYNVIYLLNCPHISHQTVILTLNTSCKVHTVQWARQIIRISDTKSLHTILTQTHESGVSWMWICWSHSISFCYICINRERDRV